MHSCLSQQYRQGNTCYNEENWNTHVIYVIICQSNTKGPFSTSTVRLIKPQHYLEVQDSGHGEPRDLEQNKT